MAVKHVSIAEKKSVAFERKVIGFLRKCRFDFVDGGPKFSIAGRQIDAFAIHSDVNGAQYFLIIEATQKEEPGYKDIRTKIRDFNDIKTDILKALKDEGEISIEPHAKDLIGKYRDRETVKIRQGADIRFILVLEDIDFDDDALGDADKYGITVWGSKYFTLSDRLSNLIGEFAKYTILRELGRINLSYEDDEGREDYVYTAFRLELTGEARGFVYLFPILPEKLLKLAYVYRRELAVPETEFGEALFNTYQRMLIASKLNDIGLNFLGGSNGSFKNNLVLVFEREPSFKPTNYHPQAEGSVGLVELKIPKEYASIRILDGQHRLYGFLKAPPHHMKKKNLIVVGIVPYANEEAETFLSINTKQKPVNTDILWDLYSVVEKGRKEATCSDTIKKLNYTEDGNDFWNKIYIPSNPKGNVSSKYDMGLGNLSKTLADLNLVSDPRDLRITKHTFWKGSSEETSQNAATNIIRVYREIRSCLPKVKADWMEAFFLRNNGFNVTMRVVNELLQYAKTNDLTVTAIKTSKVMDGISYYATKNPSPDQVLKITSSEGGRGDEAARLIFYTWLHNHAFGAEYLKGRLDFFYSDIKDLIGEVVMDLRRLIDTAFEEVPDWWNTKLIPDADMRTYAEENRKALTKSELKEERLYFLSEGHLTTIITASYAKHFDKLLRKQFDTQEAFEAEVQAFKERRDLELHFVPRDMTSDQVDALYDFHRKIHQAVSGS